MIFIDAPRGSLVGVGQMRDLVASMHLKLAHTCLAVRVTHLTPRVTLGWAAELLSALCVLACRLGGLIVSHVGTRDQVGGVHSPLALRSGKPNPCVHVYWACRWCIWW